MRKVTANTLAHLLNAMSAGRAVTIRYTRKDGEVSRRRIEIHEIRVTLKGDLIIRAWDHRDREMTTFRLDRISGYTLHRTPKLAAYRLPVVAADAGEATTTDADTDEICGFAAWTEAYGLTA